MRRVWGCQGVSRSTTLLPCSTVPGTGEEKLRHNRLQGLLQSEGLCCCVRAWDGSTWPGRGWDQSKANPPNPCSISLGTLSPCKPSAHPTILHGTAPTPNQLPPPHAPSSPCPLPATPSTMHSSISTACNATPCCRISEPCERAACSWRRSWETAPSHQQLPPSHPHGRVLLCNTLCVTTSPRPPTPSPRHPGGGWSHPRLCDHRGSMLLQGSVAVRL